MSEYLTEQEQIELFKSWIKQYSLVIIAGVCIAILVITGWRYWQQRQEKILNHASAIYDEMLTLRAQNNQSATIVQAKKLFEHYANTVYGSVAALMLSREAIVAKKYNEAEKYLQWVIDHSKVGALRQIARMRLARVLIAEQKPQDALTMLEKINQPGFEGLINEVKGDAYLALKQDTKAREAYQIALNNLPNAEVVRPLLQMKYDNLATNYST